MTSPAHWFQGARPRTLGQCTRGITLRITRSPAGGRRRLGEARDVLVVGPNPTFLRYIEQVLPSLGETSVLLSTVGELYPGLAARRAEPARAAALKGHADMTKVLSTAVRDRQELPRRPIQLVVDAGVFDAGRIPKRWQALCGVDRAGQPLAA